MEQTQLTSRHRRSKQQILALLHAFENSGLGVKEFCHSHHIHPSNFYKWKSRYAPEPVGKKIPSGFATVDIVSSSPSLFAEVNGIRIYRPVSATFLKELLA